MGIADGNVTLAMVKPWPEIETRYEIRCLARQMYHDAELRVVQEHEMQFTYLGAAEFYAEHRNKGWFEQLVAYMASGPVWVMRVEGLDAIINVRLINGATNPREAAPTSIRGRLRERFDPAKPAANFIHGSDSLTAARRELALMGLWMKR
ncbi:MAG: nucleoside-diphosphate kinase [Candidatus Paceibacterota bacterium]|nr:MAG: nucleoside-diphosphate kinase [Candidatus Paceibacterota bacterium]